MFAAQSNVLIQVDNVDHKNDQTETISVIEDTAISSAEHPDLVLARTPYLRPLLKPAFWVILFSLLAGLYVHNTMEPQWREHRTSFQVFTNDQGQLSYISSGDEVPVTGVVAYADSVLRQEVLDQLQDSPAMRQQWAVEYAEQDGK
ncbi:MAG: hypothetical protein ACJAYC_000509 [Halieaceae bacterium]